MKTVITEPGDNIILFSVQEEKESVSDVEERIAKFVRTLATLDQCLKLNQDGGVHYKVITVKESSAKKKIGQSIIATSEAEKADFLVMGSRSSSVTKTGLFFFVYHLISVSIRIYK